jgi:hypothetical protein
MPAGLSEAVAAVMEGDGGFATTGFNMRQEREEGNIDEEVRRRGVGVDVLCSAAQFKSVMSVTAGYVCMIRCRMSS